LLAVYVSGNSALANYLNWRDNIFFSTTRDTSLLQMLPCWFPKAVRRLIQLHIQVAFELHHVSEIIILFLTFFVIDFSFLVINEYINRYLTRLYAVLVS
jgi:spatacsin